MISIESGIATATKSELRNPRKAMSTTTTRISPARMLFSSSETMLRMSFDWSATSVTWTPAGRRSCSLSQLGLDGVDDLDDVGTRALLDGQRDRRLRR